MAIHGVCPDCGYKFTLEQALTDATARQALAAALEIAPALATRVVQYLGLFSPAKRAMRMDALANRLSELASVLKAATVERDGRAWAAPLEYWREGLDVVLAARDKLRLPLTDHGYLFSVVANISMKASGQQEQKREEQLRQRPAAEGPRSGPKKVDEVTRKARGQQQSAVLRGALKGKTNADH